MSSKNKKGRSDQAKREGTTDTGQRTREENDQEEEEGTTRERRRKERPSRRKVRERKE